MKHETFILPDFFTGSNVPRASIQFYTTNKPSLRNKIVFKQNLICFLVQGYKEAHLINSSVKINHHQILLLESGSVLMSEILTGDRNYESMLFFFSDEFLVDFCLRHKIMRRDATKEMARCNVIEKTPFLNNFQASVKILGNDVSFLGNLKLEELLLYLFYNHTKEFVLFLQKTNVSTPESVIKQVIETHKAEVLTIDQLAFLCNMSISTFKRHFVSMYKTSPQKYFIANKMTKAKYLLSIKNAPSEIYHDLGYESLSSFSNEFKKFFGISPRQFQKQNELTAKVFER